MGAEALVLVVTFYVMNCNTHSWKGGSVNTIYKKPLIRYSNYLNSPKLY